MIPNNTLSDLIYPAFFAALTAVLGLLSIPLPFSPVPVTGQSLGVMLAGSLLTVRQATYSILTFLLVGAVGLPVFAGATGGIGIILGPRGGYLLAFLAGAALISWLKGNNPTIWRLALANITGGIVAVYLPGILWLSFITGMDLQKAFLIGALPYIPGDLLKVITATILSSAIRKQLPAATYTHE